MLDIDGNGSLSPQELKNITNSKWCQDVFKNVSWEKLLVMCDTNGDGNICLEEFMTAAIKKKILERNKDVRKVFQILDVNGDGTISLDEIGRAHV